MKQYFFASERIGFRNWLEADLEPFAQMGADEEVMEFFPNKLSRQQSQDYILKFTKDIKTNGFGCFALDERATGNFIGFVGIQRVSFEASFTPCVEIGWRLSRSA